MSETIEYVAGVPIKLKRPFDLDFIHKYGTVFKVIDNFCGSGNLYFGVENGGRRYFVKFAGAPKLLFDMPTTEDAVEWLKDAQQVYKDLAHGNLIKMVIGEEIGGGYALVFEWADADCIGQSFPESRQRFRSLPIEKKLKAFDEIVIFHAHVAERGYVAIDFYDDQIMYDFDIGKITICDIDFYQKSPYYGDKGPWGSTNFVSPEERVPWQRIDEVTMVYTMGATAFALFSMNRREQVEGRAAEGEPIQEDRRAFANWILNEKLYYVAKKAVNDDRCMRQQSIAEFIREWNANL